MFIAEFPILERTNSYIRFQRDQFKFNYYSPEGLGGFVYVHKDFRDGGMFSYIPLSKKTLSTIIGKFVLNTGSGYLSTSAQTINAKFILFTIKLCSDNEGFCLNALEDH